MSKPFERCANCHTERYGINRKGYCDRCNPLILKKKKVATILKKLPKDEPSEDEPDVVWVSKYSERQRSKSIRNQLKEIDFRLSLLETREEQRTSQIPGLRIEHTLRDLARWCGGKEDVVCGIASIVNSHFNQEQRRLLLGWIFNIEESMRWDRHRNPGLIESFED
jgi:hypothetical protein